MMSSAHTSAAGGCQCLIVKMAANTEAVSALRKPKLQMAALMHCFAPNLVANSRTGTFSKHPENTLCNSSALAYAIIEMHNDQCNSMKWSCDGSVYNYLQISK
jgi:hypothetical protein